MRQKEAWFFEVTSLDIVLRNSAEKNLHLRLKGLKYSTNIVPVYVEMPRKKLEFSFSSFVTSNF